MNIANTIDQSPLLTPALEDEVLLNVLSQVKAGDFAARMLERGVYVTGFSFPVVPRGQARIRTQMSAGHDDADLTAAIAAFIETGRELKVIG